MNVSSQRTGGSHLFQISGNESHIRIFLDKINNDLAPDCNDSSVTNLFDFRIRSITFNKDEQEFPSNWSPIEVVPAYCEGEYNYTVHSDAFCLFLVHWGLDKPLLKIQGGHIIQKMLPRKS